MVGCKIKKIKKRPNTHAYVMSSVLKLDTIELMKFSRMITARIDFQSEAFSPSRRQIDSSANFTIAGGFAIDRTSTKCCFLIDFTALHGGCEEDVREKKEKENFFGRFWLIIRFFVCV